jgi:hypothetical protein
MKIKTLIIIFCVIILIGASFISLWIYNREMEIEAEVNKQQKYKSPAEDALKFKTGTPYVDGVEVFAITDITSNGSMDQAGAMKGDIILDKTIGEFFEEIYNSRNDNYTFKIERNNSKLSLSVYVPNFNARSSNYKVTPILPYVIIIGAVLIVGFLLTLTSISLKDESNGNKSNEITSADKKIK